MSQLEEFRLRKDEFMRDPDSPLLPEDRIRFNGLKYFPENTSLVFVLDVDSNVVHDFITLDTSDGQKRRYQRAGKIRFLVEEQPAALNVYKDQHGYFMPFRDGTSGKESYAAGRYCEPELLNGMLHVDFNYSYNPYCAYNERYSCPLPPVENWLKVRIQAGEKKFKDA